MVASCYGNQITGSNNEKVDGAPSKKLVPMLPISFLFLQFSTQVR